MTCRPGLRHSRTRWARYGSPAAMLERLGWPRPKSRPARARPTSARVSANAFGVAAPQRYRSARSADSPAQLLQRLLKSGEARLSSARGRRIHQHADAPHPLRLLRACRKRPIRRAAEGCDDELPSPHGIDPGEPKRDVKILPDLSEKVCDQSHSMPPGYGWPRSPFLPHVIERTGTCPSGQ